MGRQGRLGGGWDGDLGNPFDLQGAESGTRGSWGGAQDAFTFEGLEEYQGS